MPILTIIVVLIIAGLLLWAAETAIPMDAQIKKMIRVVVILVLCLWLLGFIVDLPIHLTWR